VAEILDIEARIKLDQLRRDFDQMEGGAGKAAAGMVKKLQAAYIKAEKASGKASKKVQRDWEKSADKIKDASEATASVMGGVFGDVSDVLIDLTHRLSEVTKGLPAVDRALVGVAGGAALVAGAIAFVGVAAKETFDEIAKLASEQEHALRQAGVPKEAIDSLKEYSAASALTDAALDRLSVTLAAEFAPEMSAALGIVSDLAHTLPEAVSTTREWADTFQRIVSLGLVDVLRGLKAETVSANSAQLEQIAAWEKTKKQADAYAASLAAISEIAQEAKTGQAALLKGLSDQLVDDETRVQQAYADTIKQIDKLDKRGANLADTAAARSAAEALRINELAELEAKRAAEQARELERLRRLREQAAREEERFQKEIAAAFQVAEDATADLRAQTEASNRELLDEEALIQAAYQDRIDAIHELERAGGDQAAAAEAQQAAEAVRLADLAALEQERLDELEKSYGDTMKAIDEASKAALDNIRAYWGALFDNIATITGAIGDVTQAAFDVQAANAEQAATNAVQTLEDLRSTQEDISSQIAASEQTQQDLQNQLREEDLSAAERAALQKQLAAEQAAAAELRLSNRTTQNEIDNQKSEVKAAKEAAQQAFTISQALATADLAIQGALAIAKSLATLGPPVPPNLPGIAGAAAVTAGIATAGIGIANAEPPSFPFGGMASDRMLEDPPAFPSLRQGDHSLAFLEPDEGVLTPQGVRTAGGPAGVERLNSGRPAPAPRVDVTAVLQVDGRTLGRLRQTTEPLASQTSPYPTR
jgi:hypothetical protein